MGFERPSLRCGRTVWGVVQTASSGLSYPIIGFTNYGGANGTADNNGTGGIGYTGFRVWDDGGGAWDNLSTTPVNYDGWNKLRSTWRVQIMCFR